MTIHHWEEIESLNSAVELLHTYWDIQSGNFSHVSIQIRQISTCYFLFASAWTDVFIIIENFSSNKTVQLT